MHSAFPVSMRTTARFAVTTASGSKVALSRRTREPIGSTPTLGVPPGTAPGSGSPPSGSGWSDLARFTRPPPCAKSDHSPGGLGECDKARVQRGPQVGHEIVGVLAADGQAEESGRHRIAPPLPAVGARAHAAEAGGRGDEPRGGEEPAHRGF